MISGDLYHLVTTWTERLLKFSFLVALLATVEGFLSEGFLLSSSSFLSSHLRSLFFSLFEGIEPLFEEIMLLGAFTMEEEEAPPPPREKTPPIIDLLFCTGLDFFFCGLGFLKLILGVVQEGSKSFCPSLLSSKEICYIN